MIKDFTATLHFRKAPGEFAYNRQERRCKGNARFRKLSYTLTSEQYREIVSSPCHYCGYEGDKYNPYYKKDGSLACFKSVEKSWADLQWITVNGIDRRDNNIGYEYSNCLPCCKTCNFAKHNQTYEEFLKYIERLKNYQR